jgi:6-pyruvoyltetrahydropterin/6-carboxytetrahydropterin synthase
MHGHNYVVFFEATAEQLDGIGRVIDFSVLKEKLGGWIDQYWDHGFIAFRDDTEAIRAIESTSGHRLFLLPRNPTAENMADHLLRVVCPKQLEGTGVQVRRVVVHETENCYAEVIL